MKIKDIEPSNKYLYRGISKRYGEDLPNQLVINVNTQKRRPLNTSRFIHELINALCVKKFGVPIRNLAFFYLQYAPASYYGTVYVAKPSSEMTFYYADGIKDFTQYYDSDKQSSLNGWVFASKVSETKTFSNIDESIENKRRMFEILNSDDFYLDEYRIKDIYDIEKSFKDIGKRIYVKFERSGFNVSYEQTIEMVKSGLYNYFKKFFEYVEKIIMTTNFNSIPNDVEVMVYTQSETISLFKYNK